MSGAQKVVKIMITDGDGTVIDEFKYSAYDFTAPKMYQVIGLEVTEVVSKAVERGELILDPDLIVEEDK